MDLIDRDMAKVVVRNRLKKYTTLAILAMYELDQLPSVPPELHWISCSERLPEMGQVVLWCNEYGSVFTSAIVFKNEHSWSLGNRHRSRLIAWMPLPEAYKEEQDERE